MGATELLEAARKLSIPERLALMEAVSRSVRDELARKKRRKPKGEDPILKAIGTLSGPPISSAELDEELYGPIHEEAKARVC